MDLQRKQEEYSAKTSYFKEESATGYEKRPHYTSLLGKFRKYRERKTVSETLNFIEDKSKILDCPCGNGRWFKLLSSKSEFIIGRDVSPGMIKIAKKNVQELSIKTDIALGDAEKLSLGNSSVYYVFSFALMKHLPKSVKVKVLGEFSRVSKKGIICSFALFNKLSYVLWKIRNRDPESYPIWKSDLTKMAEKFNLKILSKKRLTPLIGLECVIYFQKK